ncbi:MAG: PLDc N-terminal domain-containing protein [Burkholderiales bacterium]
MDTEAAVHLGGMTFWTFLVDVFVIFMFVLWIWLLISVFSDLFRRHDISGGAKVIWVIFLIILPYLGVLAYLLTQGGGMAERNQAQAMKAREEMRNIVGFSAADEIRKLDELKAKGSITDAEYQKLRARLI